MMLLWIINLTCSSKTCPNDLFSEVFSCLKHLTNGTNHTSLISGIDTVMMKRNCGNGAFDGSVQCLKRLYSRYDDPASREWLHKLARPRRWQSGFDRFCQHVNYYINERQCIQQQNTKFEACVKVNNDDFVLPKQFIHHNDGSYTVDETTLKSMCKVFDRTDKCLSGPFRNSCGKEVGAILLDFHGGLTPPMCNEFNRFHRSNMFSSTATILYPSKVNAIGTVILLQFFTLFFTYTDQLDLWS